jgi:hypothetical protein
VNRFGTTTDRKVSNTTPFQWKKREISLSSQRNVAGNEELLMAYGFVISGNPSDTSAVKLGIQNNPSAEMQSLLDRAGLKVDETHQVRFDDPDSMSDRGRVKFLLPERLTRVVRICCGGKDEPRRNLEQILEGIAHSPDPYENKYVEAARVEMQAMEVLEGAFQSKAGAAQSRLWRIGGKKGQPGIRDHVWQACREYAKGES